MAARWPRGNVRSYDRRETISAAHGLVQITFDAVLPTGHSTMHQAAALCSADRAEADRDRYGAYGLI